MCVYVKPRELAVLKMGRRASTADYEGAINVLQEKVLAIHGFVSKQAGWPAYLRPHWQSSRMISHRFVTNHAGRTELQLELSYGKTEDELRQLLRNFAFPSVGAHTFWQSALLGIRLTCTHWQVLFSLGERAWFESSNLRNKVMASRANEIMLINLLRDLFSHGFWLKDNFQARGIGEDASKAEIIWLLRSFQSATGQLYLCKSYSHTDRAVSQTRIFQELYSQLQLLLPLYEYVRWSPANDFVSPWS